MCQAREAFQRHMIKKNKNPSRLNFCSSKGHHPHLLHTAPSKQGGNVGFGLRAPNSVLEVSFYKILYYIIIS